MYFALFFLCTLFVSCSNNEAENIQEKETSITNIEVEENKNDSILLSLFEESQLEVNNILLSAINEDVLIDSLGFRKVVDNEDIERFYKMDSYLQFDGDDVLFIYSIDAGVSLTNLDLSVGKDIRLLKLGNLEWYDTEFSNEKCKAVSLYDKKDNALTIYVKDINVLGFTYSSYKIAP